MHASGSKRLVELLTHSIVPHRFVAAQLQKPSGVFGRWVMTRVLNSGNAELIEGTIDALKLNRDQTFMDVGFGGGLGLKLAAAKTDGALWGIDFSADVVIEGVRTFEPLIAAGRLNLICANVVDLPLRDGLVSAICTTNTIYFWPDALRALGSLLRVLRAGGTLAIGFSGEEKMKGYGPITQHGFTYYQPERVEALMREAGFARVHTIAQHGKASRGDYVTVGSAELLL